MEEAIEGSLAVSNVLGVLGRAKACHCEAVVFACRSFVMAHHYDIVQQPQAQLDREDMEEVVLALRKAGHYRVWPAVAPPSDGARAN